MKWVVWNVTGINKRYKHKELRIYLKINKISLAGLVDTRVEENKVINIAKLVAPGWDMLYKYNATNKRICIIWDARLDDVQLL